MHRIISRSNRYRLHRFFEQFVCPQEISTGLINTDVDKVIKAPGTLRFDLIPCPVDTSADSLPINPHGFGDGAARQADGEPSDSQVEVFRKAAPRISSGNVCNEDAVLRTQDTVRAVLDLDQRPTPVESARYGASGSGHHMTCTAYGRRGNHPHASCQGVHGSGGDSPGGILIKIVSSHNCGLDAEQLLA